MQVIVSLTTIPPRLSLIQPTLLSLLLHQTYKVNKVIVQIPKTYKNWTLDENLPSFLQNPRIYVNRNCVDDGPITKVLGFADTGVKTDKALLVYVDDDHMYPSTFIAAHVRAHELCPRTVFTTRGGLMHNNTRVTVNEPWFSTVHTADGVQGVSVCVQDVKWSVLASRAREWMLKDSNAFASDDLILSVLFWEQGLRVRIAPCIDAAIPLKHAGDDYALCNGRNGTLLGTTERYLSLNVPQEWITSVAEGGSCVSVQDDILKHEDHKHEDKSVAIAIFAYQRPKLLARVLESMTKNDWFLKKERPVFLFLDGPVHPITGEYESNLSLWKQNQEVFRQYIPSGICIASAVNYGVGVMQFWALSSLASHYEHVIMLEDDLILGPSYLGTLWALRQYCTGSIGSVQAGYRREHGAPNLVRVTDAAQQHVHYWGWLTTAKVWQRIAKMYSEAVQELFEGQYYRRRDFQKIKAWFRKHDISENGHYSQDWVRDACFRKCGMQYKLYTPCRRGVPIGRDGLHSSSALFDQMGLDDTIFDVQNVPTFDPTKAVLTWDAEFNISTVIPVCPSYLKPHMAVLIPKSKAKPKRYIFRKPVADLIRELFGHQEDLAKETDANACL